MNTDLLHSVLVVINSFTLAEALEILSKLDKSWLKRGVYPDSREGALDLVPFESLGDDPYNLI
jgi:hypothetical protein